MKIQNTKKDKQSNEESVTESNSLGVIVLTILALAVIATLLF